ncbi:hypothetical protein AJ79_00779 [Helicocarpus griseus UAMH5409]|uniref:Major facilitator superfamily (MFS) profile domain-containing protein n=1 Tax=Helicocarpus griseus UAMH5409 TaxID=1447875 RepID=A0A2B7Y9K7_9EURO|nr:hypothetical protein AJ79_00779 [Helicocarpus griseus UAMH5409]
MAAYADRARNFSFPYYPPEEAMVRTVPNVALANVLSKQKTSLTSKRMLMLYYCLFVATLCSCINGYDTSLMGSINSYPQYRTYFGFDLTKGTPTTGIVYAIYTIGNMVGSFAAGPASDFRGRRVGMLLGSLIGIFGSVIQASCRNLAGFMIGRFILGFGVAITATAGPAYVSEMAHPEFRGTMTAIYNTFWYFGAVPGTFIPYATSKIPSSMAWRIPLWLQLVFAGLVLILCFFLPETPRWLIANNRHDAALEVMAKYHGNGDRNSPIVLLEYGEMCQDISRTGSDKRWWDYRELYNSREVRYRSMLVIMMGSIGSNGLVTYYYPAMLRKAGISSNQQQLLYQGFQNVISFAGAVAGAIFTDKWGRRPQMMVSTSLAAVLFAIIMALNATNVDDVNVPNPVAKSGHVARAELAMIYIFGFVYSCGWTPNQAMYPVEVLRFENRAKGMGMYNFWVNIAQFYNTFVTDIAFTHAGWKYYFLFIFWDTFEVAMMYFFFVETKKRTLEELTEIFRARRPVKTSLKQIEVVYRGNSVMEVDIKRNHESFVLRTTSPR